MNSLAGVRRSLGGFDLNDAVTLPQLIVVLLCLASPVLLVMWGLQLRKRKQRKQRVVQKVEGEHMSASIFIGAGGQDLDQAKAMQAKLQANLDTSDERTRRCNEAACLLVGQELDAAIAAYTKLMEDFPDERGAALGQIGAAYYFKGEYQRAIEHYEAARAAGADVDMMQDNIDEAKEALAQA
ncbi:MAG: hypothetical protein ACPGUV_11210 [Polyangiales bacterium]